jgi:hypothetical protein
MPARGPQYSKKPGHKEVGSWGFNETRLWSKIDKTPDYNGCHNWQGAMSPSGALMGAWKSQHQQMVQARRLVWMSTTGEDVTPYSVTLTCGNQSCCNFLHFELKKNNRPGRV